MFGRSGLKVCPGQYIYKSNHTHTGTHIRHLCLDRIEHQMACGFCCCCYHCCWVLLSLSLLLLPFVRHSSWCSCWWWFLLLLLLMGHQKWQFYGKNRCGLRWDLGGSGSWCLSILSGSLEFTDLYAWIVMLQSHIETTHASCPMHGWIELFV